MRLDQLGVPHSGRSTLWYMYPRLLSGPSHRRSASLPCTSMLSKTSVSSLVDAETLGRKEPVEPVEPSSRFLVRAEVLLSLALTDPGCAEPCSVTSGDSRTTMGHEQRSRARGEGRANEVRVDRTDPLVLELDPACSLAPTSSRRASLLTRYSSNPASRRPAEMSESSRAARGRLAKRAVLLRCSDRRASTGAAELVRAAY